MVVEEVAGRNRVVVAVVEDSIAAVAGVGIAAELVAGSSCCCTLSLKRSYYCCFGCSCCFDSFPVHFLCHAHGLGRLDLYHHRHDLDRFWSGCSHRGC